MVRFMTALVQALRWLHQNKEPAIEFLAREMQLRPVHARKGWEYYTQNRLWPPDGEVTLEGMKYNVRIYAEQTGAKSPLPEPTKFVDQSYLYEALKQADRHKLEASLLTLSGESRYWCWCSCANKSYRVCPAYGSKPRTTDLRPWLWGTFLRGIFRPFIPALTCRYFCCTGQTLC
jgi:hypothetical protein